MSNLQLIRKMVFIGHFWGISSQFMMKLCPTWKIIIPKLSGNTMPFLSFSTLICHFSRKSTPTWCPSHKTRWNKILNFSPSASTIWPWKNSSLPIRNIRFLTFRHVVPTSGAQTSALSRIKIRKKKWNQAFIKLSLALAIATAICSERTSKFPKMHLQQRLA